MKALIRCLVKICCSIICLGSLQAQTPPQQDAIANLLASGKNPRVLIETTAGKMEFELFPKAAPKAVENFLRLVDKGYYNGITFHRIIKGFMIQGGDPTGTGRGGDSIWNKAFEDEIALGYAFDRGGLLAMANAGPNTNRSQFFITTGKASWLNGMHTIFGELKEGFDTLSTLENIRTDSQNRPIEPQTIIKASIIQ